MIERLAPDSFREVERRILRKLLGDDFTGSLFGSTYFEPSIDVFETVDGTVVKMEIPGMRKREIIVELEGDTLIIRGRRDDKSGGPRMAYHQMEIDYGAFERRVKIDMPVKEDAVTAVYRDGFLEVRLPRKRSSGKNPGRRG